MIATESDVVTDDEPDDESGWVEPQELKRKAKLMIKLVFFKNKPRGGWLILPRGGLFWLKIRGAGILFAQNRNLFQLVPLIVVEPGAGAQTRE